MVNSRSLSDLTREAAAAFERWRYAVETKTGLLYGFHWSVSSTYRDQEYQDKLFAQGRTAPGPIVTWTRYTDHAQKIAWDIYFIREDKAQWDIVKTDVDDDDLPDYQELADIGVEQGLDVGYYWKKRDACHYAFKPEE